MNIRSRQTLSPSALRILAWTAVVVGFSTPLVRRRLRLPPPVVVLAAASAPVGLTIAKSRSRLRDTFIYALQMWAYIATYQMPYENPEKLMRRVKVDYPVKSDRLIGFGETPNVRLQRWLGRPGTVTQFDKFLTWTHWTWILNPHLANVYIMFKHPERFSRASAMVCGTFDVGALCYWVVPTAPPWWAAEAGKTPPVRRIMAEAGEEFWGRAWPGLEGFFGGNPVAAMPSLHFATSVMAAQMLAETGPVAGVVGWTYALTLGFGLVYMGEHYVVDLVFGYALVEFVKRIAPRISPLLEEITGQLQALEARASRAPPLRLRSLSSEIHANLVDLKSEVSAVVEGKLPTLR